MLADLSGADAIGVAGSLMLCAAYFMVSRGRMDATALPYQLVNVVGSVLLLISLYFRPNHGAIVIEVLWFGIAITAIIGILRRR